VSWALRRFSLSFVESGELTFPAVGAATTSQSRLAAVKIETAAVADFAKKFSVEGYQDFVASDSNNAIASAVTQVASGQVPGLAALGYAERSASAISTAQGLLASPAALGASLAGFLGVSEYAKFGLRWYTVAQALTRLAQVAGLGVSQAPSVYTPSRQQSYLNVSAINALNRQVLLAQAVGVASLVSADVYDDTIGLRNSLTAALDAESINASDGTYAALQDARSSVWQDLTSRSRDGARLTTKTPTDTTPALVLAYDLYEDAERATDIVARNRLRHPGLCATSPLASAHSMNNPANVVRLLVNGQEYGGWKSVRISAGIEHQARDFDLEVTDRWPGQSTIPRRIQPGDSCQVFIGQDLVLTGYVDSTPIEVRRSRRWSGRERTQQDSRSG